LAAVVADVAMTPAVEPVSHAASDLREASFAPCGLDCPGDAAPVAADDALFRIEPVSEGEPWTGIADAGFGATLSDIHGGLDGLSLSGAEFGASATPAPEISTAAMVALGVALLTARRAGRNRWAPWKAPWRVSTVAASS
jgi:hypothetical protein